MCTLGPSPTDILELEWRKVFLYVNLAQLRAPVKFAISTSGEFFTWNLLTFPHASKDPVLVSRASRNFLPKGILGSGWR